MKHDKYIETIQSRGRRIHRHHHINCVINCKLCNFIFNNCVHLSFIYLSIPN